MREVEVVLDQILPPVAAAISADGLNALSGRMPDRAPDPTIHLGRRILRILLEPDVVPDGLREAIAEVAVDSTDPDALAVLRIRLRRALSRDAETLVKVTSLLQPSSHQITAHGERSVAIGGNNTGIISTGDNSSFITGHGLGQEH